jgi:hypothetical protein
MSGADLSSKEEVYLPGAQGLDRGRAGSAASPSAGDQVGLAVALHSQPLEIPQLRDFVRVQFCAGAYPHMVLRFGVTGQTAISVRRPVDDVLF